MDSAQFQQLLTTFANILSENQQKLFEELKSQKVTISSCVANVAPFENYDAKKEKFTCYIERFENYLEIKNVSDMTKKAQLLANSVGSVHYNNLSAFLGPEKSLRDLSYVDLINSFSQMLAPKKNIAVSQHYFLCTFQTEKQTIAEYLATLQRNLSECNFYVKCECSKSVSVAEVFLRVQFIRGIRDNWIREQLLQFDDVNFDEVLTKALALEASRIQSKELMQRTCPVETLGDSEFRQSETNKVSQIHKSRRDSHLHENRDHFKDNNFRYRKTSNSFRSKSPSFRNRTQSQKVKIDYRELGINNLCFTCGKSNHKSSRCRIDRRKLKCESCKKEGHVSKVCIKTLIQTKSADTHVQNITNGYSTENNYPTKHQMYGVNNIEAVPIHTNFVDLFDLIHPNSEKYIISVSINGKEIEMEVDSGTKYSILPEDKFNSLNLSVDLEPCNINFRAFSNNVVPCKGRVNVTVKYKKKSIISELYIVPSGHASLIGRSWIRDLDLELKQIDVDMSLNSINSKLKLDSVVYKIDDIVSEFKDIFEEKVGCVPKFKISLSLRKGAKPIFTKERNVPYALRDRVEKELDSLEKAGIITPVTTTDWGSPLVVIPKPDGGVRLCVDYKCGVNEKLVSSNYPIRRIEDILHSLRNSVYFCKLDLFKAYLHLPVDEHSSIIQTITTHKGTYRMNRLSFGIKTAPSEFNRILSQILQGLPKCETYFDDIIVHGVTKEECTHNLRLCLKRLLDFDLHVNRNKCTFFETKIDYLGHVIEKNKIRKSPNKVRAVSEIPRPTNVDDVRRFLGMLTYYSQFIPDFSTMSYPLRKLLCKGKRFEWTSSCESEFIKLKSEMCNDRILVPYDPTLPIVLTSDASPVGIAAILSHIIDDQEKPVAYASRSLTASERNYSQLDKEALAIVFGVNRFYNYIYGRNFVLVTDNEPLTRIFAHNRASPQMTSARLLRYASFLSGFDYTVKFKKGKENENVDCLSRAPISENFPTTDALINEEVNQLYSESLFQISSTTITASIIAKETSNDSELQKIIKELQSNPEDSPFTISNDVLFRQDRVVIPKNLRDVILKELHSTHIGITKMKQLARRYVYWKGIDHDIEQLVKSCEECAKLRKNPPKVIVHPWDIPETNWERIHIDYAGPFEGHYFLICMDAKSKWSETRILRDAPTSSSTMNLLNDIFSFHGYPNVLVSDNATIFTSEEFRSYCTDCGISQKFIAPGHPATNGLAERNVQTFKQRLKSIANEPGSIREKVQKILFRYRATPLACGKSPAELYLNRKFRIKLDTIFPNSKNKSSVTFQPVRSLKVGERVQARVYRQNMEIWQFGVITRRLGSCHYIVKLDSGRIFKRHINQLHSTRVPLHHKQGTSSNCQPDTTNSSNQKSVIFSVPKFPERLPDVTTQSAATPNTIQPELRRSQRTRRPPAYLRDYQLY